MHIRINSGLCVASALALGGMIGLASAPAHAALPFTADSLASLQATLDHCIEIDKERADYYRQFIQGFTRGVSEGDVLGVKNTDAYRDAYKAAREKWGQIDDADTLSTCHQLVPIAPKSA